MSRLKVVEVMEATTGGTRRHLFDIVTHLDRSRFQVSVICSNLREEGFGGDLDQFRRSGVQVHEIPMYREISLREDLRAVRQIRALFTEHGYDLIHTHSTKAGALARLALSQCQAPALRPKLVHTPHVFPFLMEVSRSKRWVYLQAEKRLARWTDRFIAVSETDHEAALAHNLCPPERIAHIVNGIDPVRFLQAPPREVVRESLGIAPDAFVVGHVGRLTKQKGQEFLLKAVPSMLGEVPEFFLLIVGEGEDRAPLETLARGLNVADRLRFMGRLDEVENLYPAMDVFILPSLWEGCPYTILETMYSRLPIIATDIPGNREVVEHGVTGELIRPHDPGAIAESVVRMHRDRELRKRMGEAGRKRVEDDFTVGRMVRLTERLYEEVLGITEPPRAPAKPRSTRLPTNRSEYR